MRRDRCMALVLLLLPAIGVAQDSQFGLRGLGQPGRRLSARALATGGAFGPFDFLSVTNPAVGASTARITAHGSMLNTSRSLDGPGLEASLGATRFPLIGWNGPFFFNSRFSVQFNTYLDRSFEVITSDTIALSGGSTGVTDVVKSDGGVSDLAFSFARRFGTKVQLGAALHLLVGSAKVSVTRDFEDSTFIRFRQQSVLDYRGVGFTLGGLVRPTSRISISGYIRSDGELTTRDDDGRELGSADLPIALGGGVLYSVSRAIRLATAGEWRSWSDAQAGLQGNGVIAFNAYEVSAGLELGAGSRVLRFGGRYSKMPFGPASQPTEVDLAMGFGFAFSGGRGLIDIALERAWRNGELVSERLWNAVVGLTVRP